MLLSLLLLFIVLLILSLLLYTRSPLEDSRLFGSSPWKILRHYLWTNGFLSNQAPSENLLSGNLVMETGCSQAVPPDLHDAVRDGTLHEGAPGPAQTLYPDSYLVYFVPPSPDDPLTVRQSSSKYEQLPSHRHRNLKPLEEHIQSHASDRFVTEQHL